ncbi:hypothetical protein CCR94_16705 [Rhodoblastus sphagnicola]|uniref:Glutamine amidotransferase domain-containing protein n=1 Tax=Rhodoblastus sphagnicola TaxID=333368 RepID=A0A2S6N364_9HYPH|nr:hypothetical protein [Rhodoblastus sphagnicola]MBB4199138.1 hypothetical protein [Rhodoblastus sphagnicola]PPQ29027.1 hypothetical protein CCR94_16705 [Rhodoblastus sphagnicola]
MSQYGLSFAPLVPPWALALLAVAAVALIGALVWRRRRGALWRGLAFAALLAALSGPSLVEETREPLRDVVAVVVDRTGSQKFENRAAQTENARKTLQAALENLGGVDIKTIEAGDAPDGEGTRLFAAVDNGLADLPAERLAGVFMVTDGVVHDIPATPRIKAPVHVLVTGHQGERDRRIELVEAPRYGLIGKEVVFTVKVEESNGPGEAVEVTVKRDGALATRVLARPGRAVKIPVKLEHGGANVIEFEAEAMPGELSEINNRALASVEGVRDHLKVLLVSGEPNPGERAWRNLLKADANVDLVHFTILRPPEKIDGTPVRELALIAFPTAELFGQKINEFDLILFDRYSNMGLLPPVYFDNIVNYVRRGGAFAIVAGPNFSRGDGLFYTPIGRLIPARPTGEVFETPFRPTLSEIGARHPVTRDLPGSAQKPPGWSEWFRQEQSEVLRGAAVLNGAGDAPLLVLSREGKGRVALLLSDQLWLWARGFQGGGPYEELMRRMAHWLMKEPDLDEEVLRGKVAGADLVVERQTLAARAGPVHVTAPSGQESELTLEPAGPGLFRGRVAQAELGLYRLSQGELTALVPVGPQNPLEYRELVSTTEKLRPLAEATGGAVWRIGAAGTDAVKLPRLVSLSDSPSYAGADFMAIRRTGASVARGLSLTPLAVGVSGLLVLLGLVIGAWAREGRAWEGRGWKGRAWRVRRR